MLLYTCLKQVIDISHYPVKIRVENFINLYMFLCFCISAGVCWVPSHCECEPTQPVLLQAWPSHTTTGRLVQAEGLLHRQDSRGAMGDSKNLWPPGEFKTDFAMGRMLWRWTTALCSKSLRLKKKKKIVMFRVRVSFWTYVWIWLVF